MHQQKDKKKYFLFLFLILVLLSSTNNQKFMEQKSSILDLKSIKVSGLDNSTNAEIEDNLNFLKNTNMFFLNKEILDDQLKKYNFIEYYNIFKLYPSTIELKLKKTKFLARTFKNDEILLIGSNGKFININNFNNIENLPMVFGKFTSEKFLNFKNTFNQSNLDYDIIKEIFFFQSGRIDIKTKDNILIKFPLQNLYDAMLLTHKIINDEKFKKNIIDLRVPNQLILSNE